MVSARRVANVLVVVAIGACGGKYGGTPGGTTPTPMPKGGIAAAGLPYHVLDGRTGREVDNAAFWSKLAASHAVCVGEEHPNPHHHWMQLEVMRHFEKAAPLALGMEMFQRPFQGVLDDYAAKRIDAAALRSRSGWEERWGYDYDLYGPTIDLAVVAHAQLLALNAAKEITKKVVRKGLDSLTPDEKAQVPELDLTNKVHRAWFDTLMEDMGGSVGHTHKPAPEEKEKKDEPPAPAPPPSGDGEPKMAMPTADQIYTVQVIWDETMADTSAKWVKANPTGHVVILAGNGHCHDSAIVGRMKRRGVSDAISIRPVIDDAEGSVAALLAKPMNDYIVVMQMPAGAKPEAPTGE